MQTKTNPDIICHLVARAPRGRVGLPERLPDILWALLPEPSGLLKEIAKKC